MATCTDKMVSLERKVNVLLAFMSTATHAQFFQTKAIMSDVDKLLIKFEDIEEHVSDANDLRDYHKRFDSFYDIVTTIRAKFLKLEEEFNSKQKPSSPAISGITSNLSLPKLELEMFSGDYTKWEIFYSLFEVTVDKNQALSNLQKFMLLRSHVTGDALSVISGFILDGSNYKDALDALKGRYANPLRTATFYLNQILQFKQNNPSASYTDFLTVHRSSISALYKIKAANTTVDMLDFVLYHLTYLNMNSNAQTAFDLRAPSTAVLPTSKDLLSFIENKSNSELLHKETVSTIKANHTEKSKATSARPRSFLESENNDGCKLCNGKDHYKIFACPEFLKLSIKEKYSFLRDNNLCFNCLNSHRGSCLSRGCKHCSKKHNSLLCQTASTLSQGVAERGEQVDQSLEKEPKSFLSSHNSFKTLLGTAFVRIKTDKGFIGCRALIDSASNTSIITKNLAEQLGSKVNTISGKIVGVGNQICQTFGNIPITIKSRFRDQETFSDNAKIVNKITNVLPEEPIASSVHSRYINLPLADIRFHEPQGIELLLGVNIFSQICSSDKPHITQFSPIAFFTKLGYIICGKIEGDEFIAEDTDQHSFCAIDSGHGLDAKLEKFWTLEQEPKQQFISAQDEQINQFYESSYKRSQDGKFIVKIPFKEDVAVGSNLGHAKRNFFLLEKKLEAKHLYSEYRNIILDYENKGFISRVEALDDVSTDPTYILPQQIVVRAEKSSTPIRICFNCSAKSDNQVSLNDSVLCPTEKLQKEIPTIITLNRFYKINVCTDMSQMYYMIILDDSQRPFFKFYFRRTPNSDIEMMQFNVLCFGLNIAPWLAIKTTNVLARIEGSATPKAQYFLNNLTYMDDICAGADGEDDAAQVKQQLITLMSKAGFTLKKWNSNSSKFLSSINATDVEKEQIFHNGIKGTKILGIPYDRNSDEYIYKFDPFTSPVTKRTIASHIFSYFDPLGMTANYTVGLKHFLQRLWLEKIGWDARPSDELVNAWLQYCRGLEEISEVRVPRYIPNINQTVTLIGFADASEISYSGVLYAQTCVNGNFSTHLILAKTRIAPLKQVTLARLELQALLTLTKMSRYIIDAGLKVNSLHLFSDSLITLNWIRMPPHRLDTYVANRVAQIQELAPNAVFRHVDTKLNPADQSCRDQHPRAVNRSMWFHGPDFIRADPSTFPSKIDVLDMETLPDVKRVKEKSFNIISQTNYIYEVLRKYEDYEKCISTVGHILRLADRAKGQLAETKTLSVAERKRAELKVIEVFQQQELSDVYIALENGKQLPKGYSRYSPFLENGIVRVQSRLENAPIPVSAKYPILIQKHSHLATLIVRFYHKKYLHAGFELLRAVVSKRFYLIGGRTVLKNSIYKCAICIRFKGETFQPKMAPLPKERFIQGRPFLNVTTDFCGFFNVKDSRLRKPRVTKGYICIFCCMASKAVHLEFVSELTTSAFLACFDRFIARRGLVQHVHSDNGTNYVGAHAVLKDMTSFLQEHKDDIFSSLATRGISWSFSVPRGPHFNGLSEAAVKSAKRILLKNVGNELLTFEQWSTLCCRIEMILNSRPLEYATEGKSHIYLAPSHCIIGDYLDSCPEKTENKLSIRNQFDRVIAIQKAFWLRWSKEYLNSLLLRSKWYKSTPNIKVGDIVYIKDVNLHPTAYPLGRVLAVHTGPDNVVRSCSVHTQSGSYVRPVVKLVKLCESDS